MTVRFMTGAATDPSANPEFGLDSHFLADWRRVADGARRLIKSFETQPH